MFVSVCSRHVKLLFFEAALYCSILAVAFVGSLYLLVPTKIHSLHRDHASQIRWRTFGTSVVCAVSLVTYAFLFCDEWNHRVPISSMVRREFVATGGVMFHALILYLGPIVNSFVLIYDSLKRREGAVSASRFSRVMYSCYVDPTVSALLHPRNDSERWMRLRHLVVAPLTEEIVFRACMVPALRSTGMTAARVAFTTPLFFGFAHVHHALSKLRQGRGAFSVFLETSFQFAYTTVFGAYESYAFLRTESLCAVTVCHAFCNAMGLPDLSFLQRDSPVYHHRTLLLSTLVIGLVGFIVGLKSFDLPPAARLGDDTSTWMYNTDTDTDTV